MATMSDLRQDEITMLQGKPHPTYRGILRLAYENGLRDLMVDLVQPPLPDNGNLAICVATATFVNGSDQRIFKEIGDCDGGNCNARIAPHKVRMAATRAKGRALRDALGIGEALAEEIHSSEPERLQPGDPEVTPHQCEQCGTDVPEDAVGPSRYRFKGHVYCSPCQGRMSEGAAAQGALACVDCGQVITERIANASRQSKWATDLCISCARSRNARSKEALAA